MKDSELQPSRPRPFEPYVAGVNAILFNPLAGALVCALNFKRLGNSTRARQVLVYGIPAALIQAYFSLRLPPGGHARYFNIVFAVASYKIFTFLQDDYVDRWKVSNPAGVPKGFWSTIGWSILAAAASVAASYPFAMITE
jgi:hypothetical protein